MVCIKIPSSKTITFNFSVVSLIFSNLLVVVNVAEVYPSLGNLMLRVNAIFQYFSSLRSAIVRETRRILCQALMDNPSLFSADSRKSILRF